MLHTHTLNLDSTYERKYGMSFWIDLFNMITYSFIHFLQYVYCNLFLKHIYFVCMFLKFILSSCNVCLCTTFVSSAQGGQKRVPDTLELGLQEAVSHHVGPGHWTWNLWKSSQPALLSTELQPLHNFGWTLDIVVFQCWEPNTAVFSECWPFSQLSFYSEEYLSTWLG